MEARTYSPAPQVTKLLRSEVACHPVDLRRNLVAHI